MKVWKRYMILACVCAVFGIITGSLFRGSYFDALKAIIDDYFENITCNFDTLGSSEMIHMLFRLLVKRLRPFAILWILSKVEFVRVFIAWLFAKWGYIAGFITCFIVMAYGKSSPGIIAAWAMPQILIYGIVYLMSIVYIMYDFKKKKAIIITLLSLLMIAGCVCETYINPVCIRMML